MAWLQIDWLSRAPFKYCHRDTLAASAYIPGWSGPDPYLVWRGMPAVDGGFTVIQPCPPGGGYCVRIAAVTPEMITNKATSEFPNKGAIKAAFGQKTATEASKDGVGAQDEGAPPMLEGAIAAPERLLAFQSAGLDIAPGLAAPNPFTAVQLNQVSALGRPVGLEAPCRGMHCQVINCCFNRMTHTSRAACLPCVLESS